MAREIKIFISEENEEVYIEMNGFIEFLRSRESSKPDDAVYNSALEAISSYLEDKQQEFLADHILHQEAKSAKDKDRLN